MYVCERCAGIDLEYPNKKVYSLQNTALMKAATEQEQGCQGCKFFLATANASLDNSWQEALVSEDLKSSLVCFEETNLVLLYFSTPDGQNLWHRGPVRLLLCSTVGKYLRQSFINLIVPFLMQY